MARVNITLPAMGEGVIEATINKWLIAEGKNVKEDEPLVEVATDKVDSEIPSPCNGVLVSVKAPEGKVVKVGEIIAIVENEDVASPEIKKEVEKEVVEIKEFIASEVKEKKENISGAATLRSRTPSGRFISPLVRSIAAAESISYQELDSVTGTGMDGRITRDDVMRYIEASKKKETVQAPVEVPSQAKKSSPVISSGDEVIEMDRVRKIIADHMVMSKRTSAHVTSFIDADVTRIVNWRNAVKERFQSREGVKLTLTPVFIEVTAKALREFPGINISVDGYNIIRKKNINIGMATALPDGNLIVPVIKDADEKSITGLARTVNDLAERARKSKLKPDEITGGTFSITNFGSYNNLAGTPIINQPQAAILGTGVARKTPAVIESLEGDMIAIRHIMILSLSYDHRVIDGALAGKFLGKIKDLLENYNGEMF